MLSEGCVTKQCSAASEKLPQLATANRYSSWMIVIASDYLQERKYKEYLYLPSFSGAKRFPLPEPPFSEMPEVRRRRGEPRRVRTPAENAGDTCADTHPDPKRRSSIFVFGSVLRPKKHPFRTPPRSAFFGNRPENSFPGRGRETRTPKTAAAPSLRRTGGLSPDAACDRGAGDDGSRRPEYETTARPRRAFRLIFGSDGAVPGEICIFAEK